MSYRTAIILLFLLSIPSLAFADAGLPMIVLTFPAMLVALIPIVVIEGVIYRRSFDVNYKSALGASFVSNLVSTIVGVPFAWLLLFGVEMLTTQGAALGLDSLLKKIIAVTLQAAWLIPYENDLYWMIPVAAMVGFIPAFFISVYLERWIVRKFFRSIDKIKLNKTVWRANIKSYVYLSVLYPLIYGFSYWVNKH